MRGKDREQEWGSGGEKERESVECERKTNRKAGRHV